MRCSRSSRRGPHDEGITSVRSLRAGLGENALSEGKFDRAVLTMVLGEVHDRGAALRGLYAALRPGGVLPVTEIFGDPDNRRPAAVRGEVEAAGFRLVRRFGGFPTYTLNFERSRVLTAQQPSPESLAL